MSCICPNLSGATISNWADLDETSVAYQKWVEHLSQCKHCQSQMDDTLSADGSAQEFAGILRQSTEQDLTMVPQSTTIRLRMAATDGDSIEIVSETAGAEAPDLTFLSAASHPELLGRLGRYDVERVIGVGGTGIVFRAFDTELHRVVALKVLAGHLAKNAAARKRFAREAQAAAAVFHPNVLPIYNVEANGEVPFLVMQYVSGQSLQARVDRDGPLPVADTLRIAKQTAEALSAAHAQGLIHRDVKPANILLEDETDRVVLGDFGLARTADDASLTRTGIVAGTPHYMSPEQASGEAISAQSDLFSLGSVAYFMLTGYPPFRAESAMSVLHCVCTKKQTSLQIVNPEVPRELQQVVERLLAKKPKQRFAGAESVAGRCEQLLADLHSGRLRLGRGAIEKIGQAAPMVLLLLLAALGVAGWSAYQTLPGAQEAFSSAEVQNAPPQEATNQGASAGQSAEMPSGLAFPMPAELGVDWRNWDDSAAGLADRLDRLPGEPADSSDLRRWLASPDPWLQEQYQLIEQIEALEEAEESMDWLTNIPDIKKD